MELPSYNNPPIVEAVIDLRFARSFTDQSFAAALRTKLGEKFHSVLEQHEQIEVSAEVSPVSIAAAAKRQPHAWFLRSTDERTVVGCAPHALSMHALAPYGGWIATLRPLAQQVVDSLTDEQRAQPLQAVGVRYVDRIVLPKSDEWSFEDYFTMMPEVPKSMPASPTGLRWEVVTQSGDGLTVSLKIASAPPDVNGAPVVIYDLALLQPHTDDSLSTGRWLSAIEALHTLQRTIFEESITAKTRELFR